MEEKSFKFKYIEENLVKLFNLIYLNKNIGKYIYYLNNDPLSSPSVPIDLLVNEYFLLSFYDGSVPTTEKIRVFINPLKGILNKYPLSDITYTVEVVIPTRFSLLEGLGQYRAFRIFDEISQMIDQQKVAGMTGAEISNFRSSKITGTAYSYFSIEINIKSSTLKGLRQ